MPRPPGWPCWSWRWSVRRDRPAHGEPSRMRPRGSAPALGPQRGTAASCRASRRRTLRPEVLPRLENEAAPEALTASPCAFRRHRLARWRPLHGLTHDPGSPRITLKTNLALLALAAALATLTAGPAPAQVRSRTFDPADFDTTCAPCRDFDRFANRSE